MAAARTPSMIAVATRAFSRRGARAALSSRVDETKLPHQTRPSHLLQRLALALQQQAVPGRDPAPPQVLAGLPGVALAAHRQHVNAVQPLQAALAERGTQEPSMQDRHADLLALRRSSARQRND